ncbi:FAD/NAD(P)-binding domain-containing protein [Xylariaceae sp. FL1019]|nr:FAD/NAD(P)-binding domain-containing protein [Xylariaceae sp. FL1019]
MASSGPAPIAIVGGGPCGLTFARLLENAKIPYVVFERDESRTIMGPFQGGTLDLHKPTGQEALRVAGLADEFEKLARRDAMTMSFQGSQGEGFVKFGTEGARDAPEIDRLQLRDMLLDSIPEHAIRWGKKLVNVVKDEDKKGAKAFTLQFADGTAEGGFRLIVGADGAWSKVRPLITSHKPFYSGYTYIEGRINKGTPQYDAAVKLVGPGSHCSVGEKRMIAIQQVSDGSYRLYAGIEEPESLVQAGGPLDMADGYTKKVEEALLGLFSHWSPDLQAFIKNAEGPWRPWPLYRVDADIFTDEQLGKSWLRTPGVTLLGDAAHVAIPNGGGVNEAMFDALKLYESLSAELGKGERQASPYDEEDDVAAVERALVAYEEEMRPRAREHVLDSLRLADTVYAADGIQRFTAMFGKHRKEVA